ncbi:uncharacterized protein A4U43_C08F9790 [Asparagus officinalis]|nr:uncharacterized protein A4U43_C08F9790 [Asparagus officinalis]
MKCSVDHRNVWQVQRPPPFSHAGSHRQRLGKKHGTSPCKGKLARVFLAGTGICTNMVGPVIRVRDCHGAKAAYGPVFPLSPSLVMFAYSLRLGQKTNRAPSDSQKRKLNQLGKFQPCRGNELVNPLPLESVCGTHMAA